MEIVISVSVALFIVIIGVGSIIMQVESKKREF